MVVKMADDVKRYLYLLGQTGLFNHFINIKVSHLFSFQSRQFQTVFQTASDPEYVALMDP